MSKKRPANVDLHSLKVRGEAYNELARIQRKVAQEGWSAIDAERSDAPTLSAITEEAIKRLGEHIGE